MNGSFQALTRSEVLFGYTRSMQRDTRTSIEAFAQTVVEIYHARTPAAVREVEFKTIGDIFHCATINAQKLRRYMDVDINARLPVDLEEAWVLALAEPYRDDCLRDLAARYGLLATPIPTGTPGSELDSLARLTREMGEAMQAIAPMLQDGRITEADRNYFSSARHELEDVMAAAGGLLEQIRAFEGKHE